MTRFKISGVAMTLMTVILLSAITNVSAQELNTLTKKEKRHGWKLLFNGKNLEGWHIYLKPKAKPGWSVEDGAIKTDFNNGGVRQDLVTDGQFKNYEFTLQWKIESGGNSGIIFNVHEDPKYPATYITGPEMQVLDNEKASDNKQADHLAGSLYDLIPADPKAVHPAGEWNTIKIRLNKGHLTFWMNGQKVVKTEMWDQQWKDLVKHSKFRNWSAFATFKEGHIALQYHGGEVRYRNIKIRAL